MQLLQVTTLADYLNRLRQDGEEVDALYRDVLIHVTEFFRDAEAWSALADGDRAPAVCGQNGRRCRARVDRGLRDRGGSLQRGHAAPGACRPAGQPAPHPGVCLRPGPGGAGLCRAKASIRRPSPPTCPTARLARFFVHENSHYQVRPEVRELVLFTPHNLLQDPPFSKLDLVICRNVLIYLQRPVQEHVFEAFHYALRPPGYLFLGSAESTDGITELFETVDKRHRFYRRTQQVARRPCRSSRRCPVVPARPPPAAGATQACSAGRGGSSTGSCWKRSGLPGVLVDEQHRVLHFSETAWRYLAHPAGPPTEDLLRLVRPELPERAAPGAAPRL